MESRKSPIRRVLWGLVWVFGTLLVIYLAFVIRFAIGKPVPKVNFAALLNEPSLRASAGELAWPLYQQAFSGFDFDGEKSAPGETSLREALPGDERWDELVIWLRSHGPELALLREASAKPLLGYQYTATQGIPPPGGGNPPLVTVLLSQLNHLRESAKTLQANARLARTQNDFTRFIADLSTIERMATQNKGRMLVEALVSLSMRGLILDEMERALTDEAFKLTDAQLQSLAALIVEPGNADGLITYDGERMFIADVVQRMYTDDGNGDGRLTLEGIRFWQEVRPMSLAGGQQLKVSMLALPFAAAPRKEVLAEYNRLMDLVEANLKRPFRDGSWDLYIAGVSQMRESARFHPIGTLVPSLVRSQQTTERYLGRRDALLVAIALRRYQLQQGGLPESLDKLVPTFLPALPVDRMNGGPLLYRIVEGKPLIYSVGSDRDDDGGRLPLNNAGKPLIDASANFRPEPRNTVDGDWVLFPAPHAED